MESSLTYIIKNPQYKCIFIISSTVALIKILKQVLLGEYYT